MLLTRSTSLILFFTVATLVSAQTISNVPPPVLGFVDISGTGTALLGQGDDSDGGFISTVGNGLFPAGNVAMASNGYAAANSSLGYSQYYNEGAGPITPSLDGSYFGFTNTTQMVLPFWDDLYAAWNPNTTLYWQEYPGQVLIMQWNNIDHYYPASAGANGLITFQIQVFAGGGCTPDRIQILYLDATFGGAGALYDNGAQATIGYIGQMGANAAWSYDTAGSAPDGSCLTITGAAAFGLAWSDPLGAGSIQANMCAGPANGNYLLAVTLNVGNFPAGWLYGIDIPYAELANELTFGYPFQGALDGSGATQIGPFTGLPSGLTVFAVGFGAPAGSLPTIHSGPTFNVVP